MRGKPILTMIANRVKHRRTILATNPNFPSQKGPCRMLSLPFKSKSAVGMQYETYGSTIVAEIMLAPRMLVCRSSRGNRQRRWDEPVHGSVTAKIQTAKDCYQTATHKMSSKWNTQSLIDMCEVATEWNSIITGERPAKSRLPGVACNLTANSSSDDQDFECNGSRFAPKSLIK